MRLKPTGNVTPRHDRARPGTWPELDRGTLQWRHQVAGTGQQLAGPTLRVRQMETIEEARTETDYESCAELLRAYVAWAQQRYQGLRWIAEIAFDPPSLERELGSLNVRYGPPNGRMFVARCSERPIGVGA